MPRDKYSTVTELYKDQSGVPILGPKKRTGLTIVKGLALGLLFVSLVGWLLFFIVNNLETTPQGSLILSVSAPESVSPGVPFSYTITLNNEDVRAVENVRVRVNYPEGFALRFSEPEALTTVGNNWEIGRIAAGEKAEIMINGVLLGETGTLRTMFVVSSYELEGFRSTLELTDSIVTQLTDQVVSLSVDSPQLLMSERQAYFTASLENMSTESVSGLRLLLDLPDGVTITESSPASVVDGTETFWTIDNLSARAVGEYSVTVTWTEAVSGDMDVKLKLVGVAQSGIDIVLDEQVVTLQLGVVPTLVSVTQVGEPSENGTVLTRVTVTNYTTSEITLSTLSLTLDDNNIDWDRLLSVNSVARDVNKVVWSKNDLDAFGVIQPDAVISLPFTLTLQDSSQSVIVVPQVEVVVSGADAPVASNGAAVNLPLKSE